MPPLVTINLPSIKENGKKDFEIDQTKPLRTIVEECWVYQICRSNVGFAKPNGGQKLRQLARKRKTIKET